MNKLYLCFLIIFLNSSSFRSVAQQSYLQYYTGITKAEEKFMNNKYADAIVDYKMLFAKYPKAVAKDCYIAAQIASLANDTESLKTFLGYCFLKGVDIKAIRGDSNIAIMLNKYPTFNNQLDSLFDKNFTLYLTKIDMISRFEVEAITKRDLLFHGLPSKTKQKNNFEEIYGKALDENTNKFIELVHKNGFIGEQSIGIKNIKLDRACHCDNENYNLELNDATDLIFFHHQCTYFNLKNEIEMALANGDIQPRMYAHFYEWAYADLKSIGDTTPHNFYILEDGTKVPIYKTQIKKMKCNDVQKQTKVYHVYRGEGPCPKEDEKTDKDRAEIGICSLKHEWAKRAFEKEHHVKLFFGMFGEL